jgi:hypothetical protein
MSPREDADGWWALIGPFCGVGALAAEISRLDPGQVVKRDRLTPAAQRVRADFRRVQAAVVPPELPSILRTARGAPPEGHRGSRHPFTSVEWSQPISIIASIGLVERSVRASAAYAVGGRNWPPA